MYGVDRAGEGYSKSLSELLVGESVAHCELDMVGRRRMDTRVCGALRACVRLTVDQQE